MHRKILTAIPIAITFISLLCVGASATSSPAVSYEEKVVNDVNLKVVIVNLRDPSIGVKTVLTDNTVGATQSFSQTVQEEHSIVSINGNFFEANKDYKSPMGNVMSNGELLFSAAGTPNIGFTESGDILFGMPGYFIHLTTIPRTTKEVAQKFVAYDTNVRGQGEYITRLYTPAFGSQFSVTCPGTVFVFRGDVFISYSAVSVGESVVIPVDGYVLYQGTSVPAYETVTDPASLLGVRVVQDYVLYNPDAETTAEFSGKSPIALLAGNARIVSNGSTETAKKIIAVSGSDQWSYSVPRTAIGRMADGRLIIVTTPSASLPKLADALVSLGCTDAVNVDGGGSSALAVDEDIKTAPGLNLTITFHVYDKAKNPQSTQPRFTSSLPTKFTPRYQVVAEALAQLGDTGMMRPDAATGSFSLDRVPARTEAAVMLVRMLGGETEALTERYSHPFADVEQWAAPYVGYLWHYGLTNGISKTLFGGGQKATKDIYVTYLLRALGYSDAVGGDFTYANAVEYAQYYLALAPAAAYGEWGWREFLRDDMAMLTYRALNTNLKNRPETLSGRLLEWGVFTQPQAEQAGLKLRV